MMMKTSPQMQLIDFFSEKWQVRGEYLSALHESQKEWGIFSLRILMLPEFIMENEGKL